MSYAYEILSYVNIYYYKKNDYLLNCVVRYIIFIMWLHKIQVDWPYLHSLFSVSIFSTTRKHFDNFSPVCLCEGFAVRTNFCLFYVVESLTKKKVHSTR